MTTPRNCARYKHRREREAAELERLQIAPQAKEEQALAAAAKASLLAQHRKEKLAKIDNRSLITNQFRHRRMVSNSRSISCPWPVALVDQAHTEQFPLPIRTRRYGKPLCGKTTVRERRKLLQSPANWRIVSSTGP